MVSMSTTPKPLEVGVAAAAVGGGDGDGGGGGKGKEQQQQVAVMAAGPPMAVPADAAEDARMKVRKPYTITKSRESWTEPEHDKFLEALQLFDRDWKKIEAFVGSKTMIQVWIWGVFQAEPTSHKHNNTVASVLLRQSLFFPLYLLEEGSFDAAIAGSDCVFHTASPFYHNVKDPKAELLDPAVNGTLNVLRSCKKASIKRVIVTSSMAAVAYNGKPRTPDVVVDETWFSDAEICEKNQQWYVLSKTLAEEAAWKFANDNGLEIITINPTMVIGPLLQPTLNTSAEAIWKFINGNYAS